jgi:hypothetical protein
MAQSFEAYLVAFEPKIFVLCLEQEVAFEQRRPVIF